MQVSLKRQRFVNWMAKCGWYPITIEMTLFLGEEGVSEDTYGHPEHRVYMTPQGNIINVVMGEDEVTEVKTMKVGV